MKRALLTMILAMAPSCGGDMMDTTPPPPAGHGTNEQVGRSLFGALCTRFASCYPAQFSGMYPAGVPACVDRFLAGQPPSTLGEPNACDDAQVAACARDVAVLDCAAAAAQRLPSSCQGC